jgi:hypothetical protein
MEETNDELQLPVTLGNYVQGKADGSVIAMEPTGFRQVWGLPFVREMELTLPNGILAFQLCVPHLLNVSPERLSRGFSTHCALLSPALYHCTFLLPLEELLQLLSAGPNIPNLCDAERQFHNVLLV